MFDRKFLRIFIVLALLCGVIPIPFACGADLNEVDIQKAGHLLNRIGYGPSPADLSYLQGVGLQTYIEEQLDPARINESGNVRLLEREETLFTYKISASENLLIMAGEFWRYRKGDSEPLASWKEITFDDADWLRGATGIGYGDSDDRTVLTDMRRVNDNPDTPEDESQAGYLSVYLRYTFTLDSESLAAIDDLILRVDYDDGFKAFLNGTQVAIANLPTGRFAYNQQANGSHEAGSPEDFDISAYKTLLRIGENVLAIQAHNRSLTSSDMSIIPELLSRHVLPGPARRVIRGIDELQQLVHIRGVYSQRQLQAVLAEFWENHFTTDYDKLAEYFDDLQNSDATDAMSEIQARAEAAQLEYQEYQFFYENALGNFGDLLLYSATSPSMLVYLDNIFNVKDAPNENYAREILELFAFGVDNGYTQQDIEQLAKCFTGWGICKIPPEQVKSFPTSALEPPTDGGVKFEDSIFLDLGAGWRFFKGIAEPSPDSDGEPTTAWTRVGFNDDGWLRAETGLGYGDGDDAMVLNDMRGNYFSVYLRRRFTLDDPARLENIILQIAYDDGYVAYFNGEEIARSANMENRGTPPAYNRNANGSHEVTGEAEYISLKRFRNIASTGENVLAIQVHNSSLNSSDLSILPRLLQRRILPGSIENGDQSGVWTFRFDPNQHDTSGKMLFGGGRNGFNIPAGRAGSEGLLDALEVVQSMADHPSTAEFICIKLIQKFVSDEITLANYKDGSAPAELVELLADAISAWNSTTPAGNIATVMNTILDPENQSNLFWSPSAYRNKVKTPVEYINSSLRALDAEASGADLPQLNDEMGMHLFTRDDPDGFPELGTNWIDTASMLKRISFARDLALNRNDEFFWDPVGLIDERNLESAEQIVGFFDELLFQNTLSAANKNLLVVYLITNLNGMPQPLDRSKPQEFQERIQQFVGLLLSMPQWNFQ
ncbi:MAG: DUF1800 family protein [Sedimentisphaerales bacterium]|nr:DUF1800 family protein [Sedimentisphaerales bacterium]